MSAHDIAHLILLHARQGQANPTFAKDQCWEIEQLAATLLTIFKDSFSPPTS